MEQEKPTQSQPTEKVESQFEKDLRESEEAFQQQFDKTSKTYHGGDQTLVPTGTEKKVPTSMPTEYDENAQTKAEPEDISEYGPEYVKVYETREYLNEYKKVLARVCPPIETVLRIKEKGLPKDKEEEAVKAEQEKLKEVLVEVKQGMDIIEKADIDTASKKRVLEALQIVCDGAFKEYTNKEDYTNYSFAVKQGSSQVFNTTKKLLETLKKIKKEKAPEIAAKKSAAKQNDEVKAEEAKTE
eukprot:CAMPEP_0176462324 /NCGR_PEP_ID=MMETSP0127-20121128/35192_1 /TAXON_ID=938130 /ORGANISM="Platyophrya macrostoma, Strain WH" /LENGTH=241 /DNA_ID=CAMNT_0017854205 /DNA_START=21 /DNA_END=746 /DNA_ORIENTATION=+